MKPNLISGVWSPVSDGPEMGLLNTRTCEPLQSLVEKE